MNTPPRRVSYLVEIFHPLETTNQWEALEQRVRQGEVQIFFVNTTAFDDHAESWALIETTPAVVNAMRDSPYSFVEAFAAIYRAPEGQEFVVDERGTPVQRRPDLDREDPSFVQGLRDNQDVI